MAPFGEQSHFWLLRWAKGVTVDRLDPADVHRA